MVTKEVQESKPRVSVYKEVNPQGKEVWRSEIRYLGRKKKFTAGTKRDARDEAEGAAPAFKESIDQEQAPTCPTISEFLPRFLAASRANKDANSTTVTQESLYRRYIIPAIGTVRLDAVDDAAVAILKGSSELADKLPATTNTVLACLSKVLRVAKEQGCIRAAPRITLLKTQQPVKQFYDDADLARLVAGAATAGPQSLAIVLLGADAGLRRGEITALRWVDVDFKHGRITVERNEVWGVEGGTKGKKARQIPMTGRLTAALQAIRHLQGPRVFYVAGANGPEPMTADGVRWQVKLAEVAAGMPRTVGAIHVLRHTFCSSLAMKGVPVHVIQALAGHSNIRTTIQYMHLAKGGLEAAIAVLELGKGLPLEQPLAAPAGS